jgi:phosphohistidine phosphatase
LPTLYLLRHAKSAWDVKDAEDHERPLAPRGRRAARDLAGHFRRRGIAPALVLASDARRTRETLDLVAPGFVAPPLIALERGLYLASPAAILRRLHRVEDAVGSVMVIGHNPGLHELALTLARRGEKKLRAALAAKMPTAALASYDVTGSWCGLGPEMARLTGFVIPADLAAG